MEVPKPAPFADFPRRFRRYGLPRQLFQSLLVEEGPFDWHNKTVFAAQVLGMEEVNRLKSPCRELNRQVGRLAIADRIG